MKSKIVSHGVRTIAGLVASALLFNALAATSTAQSKPAAKKNPARDYPVKPVPFTAVHLTDHFWAPRIEINRTVTIPFAFQKCEETGRLDNFTRAAASLKGEPLKDKKLPGYPFDDTDIYKVIEGAAYSLSVHRDSKLESYVDGLIQKIAAAQESDGYLYPARTIDPQKPHPWAGTSRWELERVDSHELYNLGHLYEAAVAYSQATGKRSLLEIALKTADLLDRTFGPGKQTIWPGHQITEMGLAKLYRETGDDRYLKLAKFLLDSRGPDGSKGSGRKYNQSHLKVIAQTEAVGHAVRATYMYSGMADVAALTGDSAYVNAIDKIWENVTTAKLYITGGIGATGSGEAFGENYQLPNLTAYNETCAAIGNDFWNQRLFLLHGDAKYIDVMERTLYNGLISGVSLDGKSFFYPNPLESNGQHQRSPWFGVACCPGNITRFIASVPGYVYAQTDDTLYINLYAASRSTVQINSRRVSLIQRTEYPWSGDIRINVDPDRRARFAIKVRIPGWARNEPVPGNLYRFADDNKQPSIIRINGRRVPMVLDKGYVTIRRAWTKGDVIQLNLPMPVRRIVANDRVDADRGRVALQRGPIVYCAEWPDNPEGHVRNLMLPDSRPLRTEFKHDLLGGVILIKATATRFAYDQENKIQHNDQEMTAIPYYAWANRGPGEMVVWFPNRGESVRPLPLPTIASRSTIETSGGRNPRAINDQAEPQASDDASNSYFHWWPKKGSTEWVEYSFDQQATVSEVEVYWFDDTGHGECRVPESWRVLYKDGFEWKPVSSIDRYGVERNGYNRVSFAPVKTTRLRLEVRLQQAWSAGIQEWKVK